MGNKRERERKFDRKRDDVRHKEREKERYHEKKKQRSATIEEIHDHDVNRNLHHNDSEINVENQIQEHEINAGMYIFVNVF